MPIGDVIKTSDEELRVITKIENGYPYTQRLEEYISEIAIIKYGDDFKTIKEVIQHCCDEYLKGKEIIDMSQYDQIEQR